MHYSAEIKGIQLVHMSWIIISLCNFYVIPPCQSIELPMYDVAERNYANLLNIFCQSCIILWLISYN